MRSRTKKAAAQKAICHRPAEFFLVQRLDLSPAAEFAASFPRAKVKSNPFGGGRMGDYEMDYMGSAEFEFGATAESNNRLAVKTPVVTMVEYKGHALHMLWCEEDGDPREDWVAWVRQGCEGKKSPYALCRFLKGLPVEWGEDKGKPYTLDMLRCHVWWSLADDVLWAFRDSDADNKTMVSEPGLGDSHLLRMLASMSSAPVEFLR